MKILSLYRVLAFAMAFTAIAHAGDAVGVPSIEPDYGSDVRTWWAGHPMNPKSPKYLHEIRSPEPVVSLQPGQSIEKAVEQLPATGGTLHLAAGTYEPFTLIGRNHIHILGPETGEAIITGHSYLAVCAEAMNYPKFDQLVSNVDKYKYKDKRVWDLYCHPVGDFYFKNLVFDGEGKTVVDFPGTGISGAGGAIAFKRVRDAVMDNCTFRNFLDAKGGLQHGGLAWGHYAPLNVWFRNCRFLGTARYAVYLDGAHGSGLVGCTIDGRGCKDGGLLFLANHDFTDDLNENGKIDPPEEKCAKFVVLAGNTFEGNFSTPVRLTGQNCLVTGNIAKGHMLELVGVYPVGEVAHRNWAPGELKIRVEDNTVGVCARALLNIFSLNRAGIEAIQTAPPEMQYTLQNNTVEKTPEQVHYTSMKPEKAK